MTKKILNEEEQVAITKMMEMFVYKKSDVNQNTLFWQEWIRASTGDAKRLIETMFAQKFYETNFPVWHMSGVDPDVAVQAAKYITKQDVDRWLEPENDIQNWMNVIFLINNFSEYGIDGNLSDYTAFEIMQKLNVYLKKSDVISDGMLKKAIAVHNQCNSLFEKGVMTEKSERELVDLMSLISPDGELFYVFVDDFYSRQPVPKNKAELDEAVVLSVVRSLKLGYFEIIKVIRETNVLRESLQRIVADEKAIDESSDKGYLSFLAVAVLEDKCPQYVKNIFLDIYADNKNARSEYRRIWLCILKNGIIKKSDAFFEMLDMIPDTFEFSIFDSDAKIDISNNLYKLLCDDVENIIRFGSLEKLNAHSKIISTESFKKLIENNFINDWTTYMNNIGMLINELMLEPGVLFNVETESVWDIS